MLAAYVKFFFREGSDQDFVVRFLLALNGCTDDTRGVVERFASTHPKQIIIYEWKEAIGKGGAIHRAFGRATSEYVGFVDADNSTNPKEFFRLLGALDDHDGVVASRWMAGSVVNNRHSRLRRLASVLFRTAVKVIFRMSYHDTQCGAKVFRTAVIKEILPRLRVQDMAFDVELLYILHKLNKDVIETPTVWNDSQRGSSAFPSPWRLLRSGMRMFTSIFTIRFRKIS